MLKRLTGFLAAAALLAALAGPAVAAPAEKGPGTVSVTGHAEATVTPDVAVVTTGVVTTGPDVETARMDNDRVMRKIIDALVAAGIGRNRIATSQFNLQPLYKNEARDGGQGAIAGYRLQNNVTVTVEDLGKTGAVIDAAFAAGANQFYGLQFAVRDDGKLRDELLRKAVQDGRHKAAVMAEALGASLGRPLKVSEAGRYAPAADSYRTLKAAQGNAPVESGSLTVGLDVSMEFALE